MSRSVSPSPVAGFPLLSASASLAAASGGGNGWLPLHNKGWLPLHNNWLPLDNNGWLPLPPASPSFAAIDCRAAAQRGGEDVRRGGGGGRLSFVKALLRLY